MVRVTTVNYSKSYKYLVIFIKYKHNIGAQLRFFAFELRLQNDVFFSLKSEEIGFRAISFVVLYSVTKHPHNAASLQLSF